VARVDEARTRRITGTVVVTLMAILFVTLFVVAQAPQLLERHQDVIADFRSIAGLRQGSAVQLGGNEVGRVKRIEFVHVSYACDPATEDLGRHGESRTDDCDATLFCAPTGRCAELEPWREDADYGFCLDASECQADETCTTSGFSRRTPRLRWAGPTNVCVPFFTELSRVRVTMNVAERGLGQLRVDSEAMIGSNSLLGNTLVSITPGRQDLLPPGGRLLVKQSLSEDIALFRERLERVTRHVDSAFSAVTQLFEDLADPRTIGAVKGLIENLEAITTDVAEQHGLVGALIGAGSYRRDFATTVREIREGTTGLVGIVRKANHILTTTDANLAPVMDDLQATSRSVRNLLDDLEDPRNRSLTAAFVQGDSRLAVELEALVDELAGLSSAVSGIVRAIDEEKGTLGKLAGDPKVAADVGRLLDNVSSSGFMSAVLRVVLEQQGVSVKDARDPAGPR
jgi:ABC-type transporter Mla subunit MlaD